MADKQLGFLFPGQGAQFVGMGKDLAEAFPEAKQIFDQANDILGYSLSDLCFSGSEEDITRTLYAQPAIFVTSLAALEVLKLKCSELKPSFVAGLSLGEFTALVAANAISFEDGLKLVAVRASAMEEAAKNNPGTMASIMGMSQEDCASVAQDAGCSLANLNSPGQFVLSGSVETVQKACDLAQERGAKRAIMLKVGGAFHSPLMQEAQDALEKALAETPIQAPACMFIPNAIAEPVSDPDQIRGLLAKQLTSSVQWILTMEQAKNSEIQTYLEIGPGKVLKGLAKKCQSDLEVIPCGTVDDLEGLKDKLTATTEA